MTAPGTRTDRVPRVPLRITLVALLVALVAVGLMVTGFAATSLLRTYLGDQRDAELRSAVRASVHDRDVWEACLSGRYGAMPGIPYAGCLPPGDSQVIDFQGPPDQESLPVLGDEVLEDATGPEGGPVTVSSTDGRTEWRVMTGQLPGGYTLVIGADLERDQAAIHRLVLIEAIVGVIVLVVLGAAGYVLVRNSLRPLVGVERTARASCTASPAIVPRSAGAKLSGRSWSSRASSSRSSTSRPMRAPSASIRSINRRMSSSLRTAPCR